MLCIEFYLFILSFLIFFLFEIVIKLDSRTTSIPLLNFPCKSKSTKDYTVSQHKTIIKFVFKHQIKINTKQHF